MEEIFMPKRHAYTPMRVLEICNIDGGQTSIFNNLKFAL